MTQKPRKCYFRELKSTFFSGGASPRTHLDVRAFRAHALGKWPRFFLDPPLFRKAPLTLNLLILSSIADAGLDIKLMAYLDHNTFVGSEIRFCYVFGIRDQNFWPKDWIRVMEKYTRYDPEEEAYRYYVNSVRWFVHILFTFHVFR